MEYVQYKGYWYKAVVMKQISETDFKDDCLPLCSFSKECKKKQDGGLCLNEKILYDIVAQHNEYGKSTLVYFVKSGIYTLLKELKDENK